MAKGTFDTIPFSCRGPLCRRRVLRQRRRSVRKIVFSTFCFFLLCCSRHTAIKDDSVYMPDKMIHADFQNDPVVYTPAGWDADTEGRLAISYLRSDPVTGKFLGAFLRISMDQGKTWSTEKLVGREDKVFHVYLSWPALYAIFLHNGYLSFTRSEDRGQTWSAAVAVSDEPGASLTSKLVQLSPSRIYVVWSDNRSGEWTTYFSASSDGGRTWRPNIPIEYDFRGKVQRFPQLVAGLNGRLIAIWSDDRDPQTLYDIRASISDDDGWHWSPSQKLNDDHEHAWQYAVAACSRGSEVYVVFDDFRDKGEEGDNDFNIYFTRSADNGATWSRNRRVNDVVAGVDGSPTIAVDERGRLFCVWVSSRQSIFGNIFLSYSDDKGETWSPSTRVDQTSEELLRTFPSVVPFKDGSLCVGWREEHSTYSQEMKCHLSPRRAREAASLLARSEAVWPKRRAELAQEPPEPLEEGRLVFADDFLDQRARNWEETAGTWLVANGSYVGVARSGCYLSWMRLPEPKAYILTGSFKLNPIEHQMALIFFRARRGRTSARYWVIGNRFRTGAFVSVGSRLPPSGQWPPGEVRQSYWYPFQQSRMYRFRLKVTPSGIRYWVDGRLMLSYQGDLPSPGQLGIGGIAFFSTSFGQMRLRELSMNDE